MGLRPPKTSASDGWATRERLRLKRFERCYLVSTLRKTGRSVSGNDLKVVGTVTHAEHIYSLLVSEQSLQRKR